MESFLIEWPEEEKWFVSHSRLEAEGKIMVFEFLKEGETKEKWQELASMTTHMGAKVENPALIWQNLIQEAKNKFPQAKVDLIAEAPEDDHPWGLYSIEGNDQPTICRIVQGKKGVYMNAVVFNTSEIEPSVKEKWSQRFLDGKVVAKSLQDTLKESNLVHLHLPNPKKSPPAPQIETIQEAPEWLAKSEISFLFHPQRPGDVQVFVWHKNELTPIWVSIISSKDDIYRGSVLPAQAASPYPAHEVLFFQYVPAVKKMIEVSPGYLAEIPDWRITPCQPCGLDVLPQTPSNYITEGQLHFSITCPNCGGKIEVKHKHYIPPVEEPEHEEELEEKVPWWRFWHFWFK